MLAVLKCKLSTTDEQHKLFVFYSVQY